MSIGPKELLDIVNSDEIKPLDSEFDIEELILSINGIDKKVSWLKDLKNSRVQRIESDIDKLEARKSKLRDIIAATLNHHKKSSLSFPGIGKVAVKESKGTWVVKDEEALKKWLQQVLDKDSLGDVIVTKTAIAKTELNKILDGREKISEDIDKSVERSESKTTLSVTVDKGLSESEKARNAIQSVEDMDMDTLDNLIL